VTVQPIRYFGDPVLRTPADPVVTFDKELRILVKDLIETMQGAAGVGLAAPQIGVGLRVFAYHVDDWSVTSSTHSWSSRRRGTGRRRGMPLTAGDLFRHQAPAKCGGQGLPRVR
jgi:hypothetical protein